MIHEFAIVFRPWTVFNSCQFGDVFLKNYNKRQIRPSVIWRNKKKLSFFKLKLVFFGGDFCFKTKLLWASNWANWR